MVLADYIPAGVLVSILIVIGLLLAAATAAKRSGFAQDAADGGEGSSHG